LRPYKESVAFAADYASLIVPYGVSWDPKYSVIDVEQGERQERGQTIVSSDGFGLLQEPNNPIFRLPLEEKGEET
tara:strand:+ start:5199 stop:5423 length:225 start_codon:yes stop_codon:yes gene_type:complete